jgi:transcriptional regulator with XRE-family HTH domain
MFASQEVSNMRAVLKVAILQKYGRQADFAEELGLCETILSRIVCGRRAPTEEQKRIISRKLGVSESELFQQN